MAAGRPGTDAVDEAWITPPSTVPRSDGIGLRVDLDSKRLSGASDSIRSTLCGQRHGLAIRPAPPPGRSARSGTSPAPAATSASARRTSVGVCLTTWWKRSFSTAPLRPNVRFTHRANGCQGSSCRSPACPCLHDQVYMVVLDRVVHHPEARTRLGDGASSLRATGWVLLKSKE